MRRILDHDPLTGITTYFDSDDETITLRDEQDVEPILEANKILFNDFDNRAPHPGDGFHRVASIPLTVMVELERQGVIDAQWRVRDEPRFLRFLDDPENIYLRTRPGKLSR